MSRARIAIAMLLAVGLGGCLRWFDHPWKHTDCNGRDCDDEMVLYSLAGGFPNQPIANVDPITKQTVDPIDPKMALRPGDIPTDTLHGWQVLGKTKITDSAARRSVHEALQRGIKNHDGSVAACFDPHHALRFKKEGKTVEWIICFMCNQIYVYEDGKQKETILISASPRPVLNEVLSRANVPLHKSAE